MLQQAIRHKNTTDEFRVDDSVRIAQYFEQTMPHSTFLTARSHITHTLTFPSMSCADDVNKLDANFCCQRVCQRLRIH